MEPDIPSGSQIDIMHICLYFCDPSAWSFRTYAHNAYMRHITLNQSVSRLSRRMCNKDNILRINVIFFQAVLESLNNSCRNTCFVIMSRLNRRFSYNFVGRVVDRHSLCVCVSDIDPYTHFSFTHFRHLLNRT